jgi:phospho-N-acetylmuramoyl-pentapeptide-transferase
MSSTAVSLSLAGLSFILTVIWGPPLIRILRHFKVGKQIRLEGPERHFSKLGTPTMGGIMIILPVLLVTLMLNAASLIGIKYSGRSVLLPLGVMVAFAILGAVDDWEGLRGRRRGKGMRARTKFLIQWIIALVAGFGLWIYLDVPGIYLPGVQVEIEPRWWYVPVAAFVIVYSSNSINLTDGLDGLAGLISATAFAAYGAIALLQGQIYLARFCFVLIGALFGFLWFNVHPALLFMGDTGSLALGATLVTVALMTGQWPLLPIIAIMPASITMSVILQIGYFKLTGGRRLFKMAPLQHHFELSGWSETQVVQRFWLISLLAALVGVALVFA